MTPRPHRSRARVVAGAGALGLALVLGLSACSGAGQPGAAAVVDGRTVSERDVQTVVAELPAEQTGGGAVPPGAVVQLFVYADAIDATASEFTGLITVDEARAYLRRQDEAAERTPVDYSEATVRAVALSQMVGQLQSTDVAAPVLNENVQALAERGITLNPRYGRIGEDGQPSFRDPEPGQSRYAWLPPVAEAAPGS